jgi:hypothetical protein
VGDREAPAGRILLWHSNLAGRTLVSAQMMTSETSPLMGERGESSGGRNGPAKRSSTYRVHEQLDPHRSKPMQYGGKGSRRERVGGVPVAAAMDLPMNSSNAQSRHLGRPEDISTSQAASLLCKYMTALFTAVGLFFVVAFSVNNLVNRMTSRGVSG